jgi:hypothetical protein
VGILNGTVKNNDARARDYIYIQIEKVPFKKQNAVNRILLNTYLTNVVEMETD